MGNIVSAILSVHLRTSHSQVQLNVVGMYDIVVGATLGAWP